MYKQNVAIKSLRFLFVDVIADIGYFPFWWYSTGLKNAALRLINTISDADREVALSVWVKNIFKPMFGQYDWQSRIISFVMRVFQIIARALVVIVWFLFSCVIFIAWIALPLFIAAQILFNLGLINWDITL
jgi:hypothetical protein